MGITVSEPIEAALKLRPHPKQEEFISLPDSINEAFYGGQAGAGKSWALLHKPIIRGWFKNKHFHGILFRRTFPQLERYHIMEVKKYWEPAGLGKYDGQNHAFHFADGGGILRFAYCERREHIWAHDTAEYSYVAWDELTHFEEYPYQYMFSRCRSPKDPKLPAVIRAGSNPLNIGHAWVKSRFIKPAPGGRVLINVVFPNGLIVKRIFIPASIEDNPSIDLNDPNYRTMLMMLPEAERKAKMEGDWDAIAGQVFTEFRETHFPGEPEHAVHVVEPFDVPQWWPKILIIDWGYRAYTWAGLFAISPEEEVFTMWEYAQKRKPIKEWASDVYRATKNAGNIVAYVVDPSAKHNIGYEMTIKQQIEEVFNEEFEEAEQDRLGGKMLMHEYLRWTPKPPKYTPPTGFSQDIANRLLGLHGIEAYNGYLRSFQPEEPEGVLPKWKIFKTCPVLIDAILACVYAEPKGKNIAIEDIAEFDGDDPIDGTRYALKRVHRYREEVKNLGAILKRRDHIIAQYHKTGDYDSFDRSLRVAEREASGFREPVKHFRSSNTLSRRVRLSRRHPFEWRVH